LEVSVNVSPRQLAAGGVPDVVSRALSASGLGPDKLCLEITETALLDDIASNASRLRALEELEVDIAVDDFGTGYSSLLYLKQFPLDVLKIDRLFTAGVGKHEDDTAIVGAVIGLARSLGLTTVAEGVEDRDQLRSLQALGCDHAQGFYWTVPIPIEELDLWMARRGASLEVYQPA
jgi:EAL domain-containing protein (putative c-di-GMP-specific phosphodiesterase class I)